MRASVDLQICISYSDDVSVKHVVLPENKVPFIIIPHSNNYFGYPLLDHINK